MSERLTELEERLNAMWSEKLHVAHVRDGLTAAWARFQKDLTEEQKCLDYRELNDWIEELRNIFG